MCNLRSHFFLHSFKEGSVTMSIHHNPFHSPCIVDQKDLNEAMIMAISEVALRNAQHCAELFGISVSLAKRFAMMRSQATLSFGTIDQVLDLTTTPSAIWRVAMTAQDIEVMQKTKIPMIKSHLEPYRQTMAKLNEQVILTLLRYTADPRTAALVSGLGNKEFMDAMVKASCSTLLQSAKNMGRPMVELTINETYLDRIFSPIDRIPVKASMRGLMARVMCSWEDYATLAETLDQEADVAEPARTPKLGRPTAVFLPPGEADTIEQLVKHGVNTKTILNFTHSEINASQLKKLRIQIGTQLDESNTNKDASRFQDSNLAVWGNATRRLIATSVFAHQRVLMSMGVSAHTAFVEAYEHYNLHYKDTENHLTLARIISAVYMPMRAGLVHLGYCEPCGTMHLLHETYQNGIDCPVCALAKFNKLGKKRSPVVGTKASEQSTTQACHDIFNFFYLEKNTPTDSAIEMNDFAPLSEIENEQSVTPWMHAAKRGAQGMMVELR
jgi:hypothetical protein